jgi:hypothetical protein
VARGDSIIRVSIIGDAKKLVGALGDADKATGGLIKTGAAFLGGAFLASKAVDTAFGIEKDALDNADRLSDALDRISGATTPAFADRIHSISFDMTDIGLSAPQFAELAAHFADFAKAAGVSEPLIENITPDLVTIAKAVAATTGKTVDEVIDDIGKASSGNRKSVADLGIVIDKTLNPDQQILSIMEQLKAKFPDVAKATDDLAGSQDELNAKWENFKTKLGEATEGPLKDVLDIFSNILDDIPQLITDLSNFGKAFETLGRTALAPLGNIRDALEGIIGLLDQTRGGTSGATFHVNTTKITDSAIAAANQRDRERNGLGR